jgi:hypothetical protein
LLGQTINRAANFIDWQQNYLFEQQRFFWTAAQVFKFESLCIFPKMSKMFLILLQFVDFSF